ncbi:carboxymuconolactone decarboxylase family protein [Novosphingobium cyanobacteriorum]|uniref:Carboxymuconolactone decarboxylase family protein n=1 Tax=Novosphingobium cyanobacteriorum TaxID=3024215 RepID=A0ABT6CEN5_9SPHN|nr:carboxymuconolactone decarboxylase family protein [Novosphingobium cyanobacteriorum]MDF8331773.1 carboxymuconolactone decarboxylase family protein [Novosphingobium cyanobacteriorum]
MADTIRSFRREELSPKLQQDWDFVHKLTGQAGFIEKGAHAPELLDFTMIDFYEKIFYGGRVDVKLKHLARLRMSLGHGCRSCNLGNTIGAKEVGYSEEQLNAIEGDRSIFSEAEIAVLELADQFLMTNIQGHLEPELYARLHEHFDDAQILELGTVMSYLGGLAKMLFVFDMAEKEDTCPFLPANRTLAEAAG